MKRIVKLILLYTLATVSLLSWGQVSVMGVSQKFQYMASGLPNYEVVDSTLLVAHYRYFYPTDNFKDGFVRIEDDIAVQISPTKSKTYSHNLHLMDRNISYGEKNNVRFRLDYNDFEYFYDSEEGCYEVDRRIPYSRILYGNTQVVEYKAKAEPIEWAIDPHIDTLLGYKCMSAVGRVAGREWRVWFTFEIPVRANLWLFGNLPGLVLRAESTDGNFLFDCYSLRQVVEPICHYRWLPTKTSREKWLTTEREMYANPADYFSQGNTISAMSTNGEPLKEKWTVRYAPLELE